MLRDCVRLVEPTITLCASQLHAYLQPAGSAGRLTAVAKAWRSCRRTHYMAMLRLYVNGASAEKEVAARRLARDAVSTAADLARFAADTGADWSAWRQLCTGKGNDTEAESCTLFAQHTGVALHPDAAYAGARVAWCHTGTPLGFVQSTQPVGDHGSDDAIAPGPYILQGAIDGWTADGCVIECKLRLKREPQAAIPRRELLQLQAYMAMTGTTSAWHVQRRFGTPEVLVTRVPFDAEQWQTKVRPGLDAFACDVRRVMRGQTPADESLQLAVLRHVAAVAPPACVTDTAAEPRLPAEPQPHRRSAVLLTASTATLPQLPRTLSSRRRKSAERAHKRNSGMEATVDTLPPLPDAAATTE